MKPEHVPHDIFEAFVRAFIAAKPGEYVIDGDRVAAAIAPVTPPATVAALRARVAALEKAGQDVCSIGVLVPESYCPGMYAALDKLRAALEPRE